MKPSHVTTGERLSRVLLGCVQGGEWLIPTPDSDVHAEESHRQQRRHTMRALPLSRGGPVGGAFGPPPRVFLPVAPLPVWLGSYPQLKLGGASAEGFGAGAADDTHKPKRVREGENKMHTSQKAWVDDDLGRLWGRAV